MVQKSPGSPIQKKINTGSSAPYWVFVCNPKMWAIDQFLNRRIEYDNWGVRPSDRKRFAPGQLGILRVGVDRRSNAQRNGSPPLKPGIYALCEVKSTAFNNTDDGTDEFWAPGAAYKPRRPTVKLRYLRTFLDKPLTIEQIRAKLPDISHLLLNGFQAASFPIPENDFRRVMVLLGGDPVELVSLGESDNIQADKLAALEKEYLHAAPEVKERLGKSIERGEVGAFVKKLTGFKCQVCEAIDRNPIGFLKPSGEPYVEAHHVMPVSSKEIGSLSTSNVMTLCANHHRQMHYGGIDVEITSSTFEFIIDGISVTIPRLSVSSFAAGTDDTNSEP